jgi:hypothetical protein
MFEMHSATLQSVSLGQLRLSTRSRFMLPDDVAPMAQMDPNHPLLRELDLCRFGALRKLCVSSVMLRASFSAIPNDVADFGLYE